MATQDDVRRIALSLPDVSENEDGFAFSVAAGGRRKLLCWVWLERRELGTPRVPNDGVIGVRCATADKDALLAADPRVYFTEPHYDGYPAVLVRLAEIDQAELTELLTEAWRIQAPKRLVREYDRSTTR